MIDFTYFTPITHIEQRNNLARLLTMLPQRYNTSMPTFNIEQTDSQCAVTWRYHDSSAFTGFILLAVVTIVVTLLTHLPLWGLALFFVALAIHTWTGKTKIVLNADGITSPYTNLIRKRKPRVFPLDSPLQNCYTSLIILTR